MYFGLQTSFVFNKRASGVSEEYRCLGLALSNVMTYHVNNDYRFHTNRGLFFDENGTALNIPDPLYDIHLQNGSFPWAKQYIQLPSWVDCSENSSR